MKKFELQLPSYVAITLSLVLGIIAYLNQQTFGFAEPWNTLVTAGIAAIAALGIAPAAHGALATVLKLPYNVAITFASIVSAAAVGLATVSMDAVVRAILVGALTALAGLLGGTAFPTPVTPAPKSK